MATDALGHTGRGGLERRRLSWAPGGRLAFPLSPLLYA